MDPPKSHSPGNPPCRSKRRSSRDKVSAGCRSGRSSLCRGPRCRSCPATSLTHTHTHTVRQTTVGVGTWVALGAPRAARGSVHDGVGGDGDCVDGVALSLWTLEWWKWSNGLAVVLRLSGSRDPSEWSVESLERAGVVDLGGVLEAPTLGSIGFRFSRVPPPTFSAAHTDLEYLKSHVRDGGPPSRCIYVATWCTDFGQP